MITRAETKHQRGPRETEEIIEVFIGYGGTAMPHVERIRCKTCKRVKPMQAEIVHTTDCPHYDAKTDNLP